MSSAAAEKFMDAAPAKADALPWLKDVPKDAAPGWMKALRETGADVFSQNGLPHANVEGWQYINLRPLTSARFSYSTAPVATPRDLPAPMLENAYRITVINGKMQADLSDLPAGVTLVPLDQADGSDEFIASIGDLAANPMKALNTAYLRDGFALSVQKGKDIERPIEVLFYTLDGTASYPRVVYQLAENSGLTVVERHIGAGAWFANAYAEIVQQPSSRFKYYRFVDGGGTGFPFVFTNVRLLKNAQFEGFSFAAATSVARQEFQMKLLDTSIHASLGGIYLLKGTQSHDFSILADHFEPDGKSIQHFKGVIDDQARAVFQGKIHVRRSAQKTDGYQSHHALLLSKDAEASAKPELEIYADDVKCSHGATSGFLDEGALFYMRSRGIPEKAAKSLLIQSFIAETTERITNTRVRDLYVDKVIEWLAEGKHD